MILTTAQNRRHYVHILQMLNKGSKRLGIMSKITKLKVRTTTYAKPSISLFHLHFFYRQVNGGTEKPHRIMADNW